MNEMVQAIGAAVEEDILCEVKDSPYFSIILDEATDIAVIKQLGICVQYLLNEDTTCLLYTSPSPRDATLSRMPSSA